MQDSFIRPLIEELDNINAEFSSMRAQINPFEARVRETILQSKRNIEVQDLSLEEDFREFAEKARDLFNRCESFWQDAGGKLRGLDAKNFTPDIAYRTLISKGKTTLKNIDDFLSEVNYAQRQSKGSPVKINWWIIDSQRETLARISAKITFINREITKLSSAEKRGC